MLDFRLQPWTCLGNYDNLHRYCCLQASELNALCPVFAQFTPRMLNKRAPCNSLYARDLMAAGLHTDDLDPECTLKMSVKSLTAQPIRALQQLFRQAKCEDPSGDVSNPESSARCARGRSI